MKKAEEIKELRDKDLSDLDKELVSVEKELLNLKFRHAVNQVPDVSLMHKLRKKIARIKTVINQKKLAEVK